MQHGLTAKCFPLIEGCSSISAACRSVPVIYFFRAGMLPCSFLLVLFWLHNARILSQTTQQHPRLQRTILICGIVGGLFLILYVIFLGTQGDIYRFLRRFGVYVFFGGTALAQLLTVIAYRSHDKRRPATLTIQAYIVTTMLLLGPANLIQKVVLENSRQVENIIEWHFGLLLCLYFIVSAFDWRNRDITELSRT